MIFITEATLKDIVSAGGAVDVTFKKIKENAFECHIIIVKTKEKRVLVAARKPEPKILRQSGILNFVEKIGLEYKKIILK